jgi:hypothetical protein
MASLPKPLIALLVATVAAFALWTAVLKKTVTGSGSSSSSSAPALQSAINKAHQAVTTSNQASVAHGGTVSTTPAPAPKATTPAPAPKATTPPAKSQDAQKAVTALKALAKAQPAKAPSIKTVVNAIAAHKVVALLFYNPSASDDQAVKQELATISTDHGKVARFSIPVSDLSQFQPVTSKVPVASTPTLLVIDKQGATTTLTGFVDQLAISQTVSDALHAR